MVEKGQICVRTGIPSGMSINNDVRRIGYLFKATCSHEHSAYYNNNGSIAKGNFRYAIREEIHAYNQGCRNINQIKYFSFCLW